MPAITPDGAPHLTRWQRIKTRLAALRRATAPSSAAWRGATLGVGLAGLALWLSILVDVLTPDSATGPLLVILGGILVAVAVGGLAILLAAIVRAAPLAFRWTAIAAAVLLAGSYLVIPVSPAASFALVGATLVVAALAGGSVAVAWSGQWRTSHRAVQVSTAIIAVFGIGSVLAAAAWVTLPGKLRPELLAEAAPEARERAAPDSVANPAERGPHEVEMLTYGSGSDAMRPEYAADARLTTKPVDASKILNGWRGLTGWWRSRFWQFDAKALPLNGRVWYPKATGPFPLVLVVHGNHLASDFSDGGYAYLGELLASRGMIFVSVDENFLNGMETEIWGGLEKENNARGWLLLEHLRLWHDWNRDRESPFHGQVDTDRIALVGHSRGGEAAAHAAAFNRLPYNPDNAEAKFEYGFQIRSIVAIAPADGQYKPSGIRTPLKNISYLTIQGSHDSDVSSFVGLRQFDRVKFDDQGPEFKSAIYIYGANHGQFNSSWGAFDTGAGIVKRFVNTCAMLGEEEQRQIAQVFLSAFLESTLRDAAEYRPLFQDARYGGHWLPQTTYLTQYADATAQTLCDYEEDLDLTTTRLAGGRIAGSNLTRWREGVLKLREGPTEDRAVTIGWDRDQRDEVPQYQITWRNDALSIDSTSMLTFALADANEDPLSEEERDASGKPRDTSSPRAAIDLTVELVDASGHSARLPLSRFAPLIPQIETHYLKSAWLQQDALSEPVFQTFMLRVSDFGAKNAELDPSVLVELRLVFDRTASGVVLLDRVAFSQPR